MNSIMILCICAIVVQFITERIKQIFSALKDSNIVPIVALTVGIVIAMATRVGLFASFGVPLHPEWIDWIITGIAYSGGAMAFNELVKLISELRPSSKNNL